MFYQIKSYLKFLWHSKNEHGVHSPFVYDLVTKCFYNKKRIPEYSIIIQYREALLWNKNSIEITDFGSGSKVFQSNSRQISKIAKTAGITTKRAKLLLRLTNYFSTKKGSDSLKTLTILELGTSLGIGTASLSLGNPNARITTVEGCKESAAIAQKQFKEFKLENINSVVSEFSSFINNQILIQTKYDIIYFDGNHSKAATLSYFEQLLPTITNESVWIFDDIRWSKEMEEAWEIIKQNPKVKVSIDTFKWGLVFFRQEQVKEHFTIRV